MTWDHIPGIVTLILPVITLIIGWLLNSFTPFLQDRREFRKGINKALTELLEIRHELMAKQLALQLVQVKLPPDQERVMRRFVSALSPKSGDLPTRYNEAVSLIGAYDPFLAFQLRAKEQVVQASTLLAEAEKAAGQDLPLVTPMEDKISEIALSHLNEVIPDVAALAGWRSKKRAKFLLARKPIEPEVSDLLTTLEPFLKDIPANKPGEPPTK